MRMGGMNWKKKTKLGMGEANQWQWKAEVC